MHKKNTLLKSAIDYIAILIGAILAAFAIEEFLVPCTILDGGIVGISFILSTLSRIPMSVFTIFLNIPFLIISSKKLGHEFIIKSTFAMVVFSGFLQIFESFTNATSEYLLAVCFGGVILGIGVGLVIRFGGCLDGTEAVAILLNKKYKLPVGQTVLTINIIIYIIAAFLFGFDRVC